MGKPLRFSRKAGGPSEFAESSEQVPTFRSVQHKLLRQLPSCQSKTLCEFCGPWENGELLGPPTQELSQNIVGTSAGCLDIGPAVGQQHHNAFAAVRARRGGIRGQRQAPGEEPQQHRLRGRRGAEVLEADKPRPAGRRHPGGREEAEQHRSPRLRPVVRAHGGVARHRLGGDGVPGARPRGDEREGNTRFHCEWGGGG